MYPPVTCQTVAGGAGRSRRPAAWPFVIASGHCPGHGGHLVNLRPRPPGDLSSSWHHHVGLGLGPRARGAARRGDGNLKVTTCQGHRRGGATSVPSQSPRARPVDGASWTRAPCAHWRSARWASASEREQGPPGTVPGGALPSNVARLLAAGNNEAGRSFSRPTPTQAFSGSLRRPATLAGWSIIMMMY